MIFKTKLGSNNHDRYQTMKGFKYKVYPRTATTFLNRLLVLAAATVFKCYKLNSFRETQEKIEFNLN